MGEVQCTDDDNVKHRIIMSTACSEIQFGNKYKKTIIEFDKLYLLTPDIFQKVKEKAGYDVCIKNEDITLQQIITNIKRDQNIDNLEPYNGNLFDIRFEVLPGIVSTWFSLLKHLQIIY